MEGLKELQSCSWMGTALSPLPGEPEMELEPSCHWDPSSQYPPNAGTESYFLPISVSCLLSPLPTQPWGHSGLGGLLCLVCPTSPALSQQRCLFMK